MTGKLFERLSDGAHKLGFYVVRFNWRFFTNKTEPSEGLKTEAEDLSLILDHYSKRSGINRDTRVLASKSIGTRIAMLGPSDKVTANLLLTPNCSAENRFRDTYDPIYRQKTPAHIVISSTDPYCDISQIYGALKDFGSRVTIHTLSGDHNFVIGGPASTMNEDAAIQSSLNWLNVIRKP